MLQEVRFATLLSPGDKLRDYEIIAPLTEGGMATLMLARRRGVGGFSRLVALKLVHQHLTEDSAMIRLFFDEARISAHVTHPNVVHVEEVGVHGDMYFIAMEYVHGVSLAHLLNRLSQDRRRMSPTLAVCLASQVAEALHAAHEAVGEHGAKLHVVHRDVSPQNVLLAHTGHVKLIDFGIAKSHAALHQTRTGAGVLGKLRYMSPEQLNAESVDLRTDVYALGVVLWEMLAARSFLRCHRVDDPRDEAIRLNPPPPSRYSSLVKPALDRVILKALAPNPNQRYASALDFRRALLKAQPDAARIDALKLATMMHAVVGDELEEQAAKLPHEVTQVLEDTLCQRPREITESLSELTMQLALADMDPSGEHRPPAREEVVRADATRAARYNPTYAAQSVSPQSTTLRPHARTYAPLISMISVGFVCLALGLWIGRATAPQAGYPGQGLVVSRRTLSVAAASPEPKEHIAHAAPMTQQPKPRGGDDGVDANVDANVDEGVASAETIAAPAIEIEGLDLAPLDPRNEPAVEELTPPAAAPKRAAFVRKRPVVPKHLRAGVARPRTLR